MADVIYSPDWKVALHLMAKIHNRLAEMSGSPYRVELKIAQNGEWEWMFPKRRWYAVSKFWQFVLAAILGTALGLTLGNWVFLG